MSSEDDLWSRLFLWLYDLWGSCIMTRCMMGHSLNFHNTQEEVRKWRECISTSCQRAAKSPTWWPNIHLKPSIDRQFTLNFRILLSRSFRTKGAIWRFCSPFQPASKVTQKRNPARVHGKLEYSGAGTRRSCFICSGNSRVRPSSKRSLIPKLKLYSYK